MTSINYKRLAIGTVAGWVVFLIWEAVWNFAWAYIFFDDPQAALRELMENAKPRYGMGAFYLYWFTTIFLLVGMAAWLYAAVRSKLGPGPKSAALIGCSVGFAAGFPINGLAYLMQEIELPFLVFPLVDLWVGILLATVVAGWLYKE